VTDAESLVRGCEVTRLFPDGLTLLTGYGQFKIQRCLDPGEVACADSLYPPQMPGANQKVREIRDFIRKPMARSLFTGGQFGFRSF